MPQVTLTYTFATELEAAAFLSRQPATGNGKDAPPAPKPAPAAAKPAASPPSAAPTPAAAPVTPPASSAAELTPEQVQKAYMASGIPEKIQKLVGPDQSGKAAAIKLLGEFSVKKGSELKPPQFDAFNAAIDKLLAPADSDLS